MKKIYTLILLLMIVLGNISYSGTWQDTVKKRARERGISYAEAEKQLNKEMKNAFQTYIDYEKDKNKRNEQAKLGPQPIPKNLITRIKKEKTDIVKDEKTGKNIYIIDEKLYNDILYIKSSNVVNMFKEVLPEYVKYNEFSVEILNDKELLIIYYGQTDEGVGIIKLTYHINFTYKTDTDKPTANYLNTEYIFADGSVYYNRDYPFSLYDYFEYIKTELK